MMKEADAFNPSLKEFVDSLEPEFVRPAVQKITIGSTIVVALFTEPSRRNKLA